VKTKHAIDSDLLLKSLTHWQDNWDRFQNDTLTFHGISSKTCPLCQVYSEYQPTNPCRGCPIYEDPNPNYSDIDPEYCRASPWPDVAYALGKLTIPGITSESRTHHTKLLEHAILAEYKYIANLWLSHIKDQ
jgi:hypothetical protein